MDTIDITSTTRHQHARDAVTARRAATVPPASRRAVADLFAFQGTVLLSAGFGGAGASDRGASIRMTATTTTMTAPKFVPDVDPFRTRIPPV